MQSSIIINTPDALSLDYDSWRNLIETWGEPKFRADQICQWIYSHKIFNYDLMSNLSKDLRAKLNENVLMTLPILIKTSIPAGR